MVPLNLDERQESLFKNVELVLQSKQQINVKLNNKTEESNLALWLNNKGFNLKNLLLEKILKVTTCGKKVSSSDFLENISEDEESKIMAVYIINNNIPSNIRSFMNYLKFSPVNETKYFIKICEKTSFDLRDLCKAFKTDSLKLINQLVELNFIKIDCQEPEDNSQIHYAYMQEGATFTLTPCFYLYLLNTSPKGNKFLLRDLQLKAGETHLGKLCNAA
jgi:hypothetical protein